MKYTYPAWLLKLPKGTYSLEHLSMITGKNIAELRRDLKRFGIAYKIQKGVIFYIVGAQ